MQVDEFAALIDNIQAFWGQEVYGSLGPAIAKRKWYMRLAFAVVTKFGRGRLVSYLAIAVVVLFYPHFRRPGSGAIFQYDASLINKRVFDRMNRILVEGGISDFSLNGVPVSFWTRSKLTASGRLMLPASRALATNHEANPFIRCQQVVGCAALLLFDHVLTRHIRLICVANDHFPANMALLAAAKRSNIATCYLQHAPVTQYFPPLAFDLSVLFDRASLEFYQHAAALRDREIEGRVIILSPFEEVFRMPALGAAPFVAGVCLSLLPKMKTVIELLEDLARAECVDAVHLRRHPRCRADLSTLSDIAKVSVQPSSQSAAQFFEDVDFVLVPSSGIAIESLHQGRPTFYTPDADELTDDYYGFTKRGILPVYDRRVLGDSNRMTAFFDDDWRQRFGYFDETVHRPPGEARVEFLTAVASLSA